MNLSSWTQFKVNKAADRRRWAHRYIAVTAHHRIAPDGRQRSWRFVWQPRLWGPPELQQLRKSEEEPKEIWRRSKCQFCQL